MALRVGGFNFTKGELAAELLARVDVPSYASALKRARNVVLLKYGGVAKRPGTRFIAEVFDNTKPTRLMPFQFSLTQTYALEMGQGYMRPAALGGLVLETNLTVQAVTRGPTTNIQADYHGYVVGDQLFFQGVQGATQLNGKFGRVISVPDANHFVVNINSSGFGARTGDTGGIINVAPPAPPPTPPVVPPVVPPATPPVIGAGSVFVGVPDDWRPIYHSYL